jgi:hypothetical protein
LVGFAVNFGWPVDVNLLPRGRYNVNIAGMLNVNVVVLITIYEPNSALIQALNAM